MNDISIRSLSSAQAEERIEALSEVLIDCVEGGASINFMAPLDAAKAGAFWRNVAEGLARGDRALLVAEEGIAGRVVGTVQVVFAEPENQPHRADLRKMLVCRRARGRGIGAALMRAAEEAALAAGKTLLVLDTASSEAERLYRKAGWTHVGIIPDYALMPDGRPCDTTFFYKRLP